jgi:hypothetical protein
MKRTFNILISAGQLKRISTILFMLVFLAGTNAFSQDDSTVNQPPTDSLATVNTEEEEPTTPELISPAIEFVATQKTDKSIDLAAKLQAKVKGWPVKLYRMKLSFYQVINEVDTLMGTVITNGEGRAILNIKPELISTDAEGKYSFKVVFAGNKSMESAEEITSFKRAVLSMDPVKEDSLLNVHVTLMDMNGDVQTPVTEATVGIYVNRLFMPMKVGEGTTDENGEAIIEFPAGIPGDEKGNLTLIARVDENETYGNLLASSNQSWGIAVSNKRENQQRELWSSNPPIWMLITFIVLMVAVWGHYLVIVYELFRLRKEKPVN